MKSVLVFKTTVETRKDVSLLSPFLQELAGEDGWNFALEDRDRILRVTSAAVDQESVIRLLASHGYRCEELEDALTETVLIQPETLML